MPSSYSSLLRIELPATGEQSGTWGTTLDTQLGTIIEQAIAGMASVTMTDADYTLSALNGVSDESRCAVLSIGGGVLTATRNVIVPTKTKTYIVKNSTTGGKAITVKTSGGTGITIPNGQTGAVFCDGTNVVVGLDFFSDASFTLVDDADVTKKLQFQLNGITTGTTRTLTVPDSTGTIATTAYADAAAAAQWTTGDVKLTLKTVADSGWVLMNDGTIGDGSSGGTTRANADTSALFTLLWNNTSNTDCPVSGGRGASAAADFAAHKTITLPKALGRALAIYGSGSGLSARTLGQNLGSENSITVAHQHTGTTTTNGSHQHTNSRFVYQSGGGVLSPTGGGVHDLNTFITDAAGDHNHTFTTDSAGSSGTGANMQPTVFLNVMIKL